MILVNLLLLIVAEISDAASEAPPDYSETIVVTAKRAAPEYSEQEEPAAAVRNVAVEVAEPGRIIDQLDEVAGLDVNSLGPGQRQTLSLRGSSASQVLLLYNGIPLNSALGGGADLSALPLEQIEQVVVRRDSGSALYGDGALAGSVELLDIDFFSGDHKSGAYGQITAGSLGTVALNARGRYLWQKGGTQLTIGARRWNGLFNYIDSNGIARQRLNNDGRQLGGTLSLGHRLKGQSTMTMLAQLYAGQHGVPGPNQLESGLARQNDIKSLLGWHFDFRPRRALAPQLVLDAALRFERLHFTDPRPLFGPKQDNLDNLLHGYLSFKGLFSPLSWQRLGALVKFGLNQVLGGSLGDIGRFEYQVTTFDQMDFFHERLLFNVRLGINGNDDLFKILPEAALYYRFLYKAGAVKEFSIYINSGRGVRFPSFYELYVRQEGLKPNPKLLPESGWNISGGLHFKHEKMAARLALFHRWQENLILFVPQTINVLQAVNFDHSRAYGLEAEFSGTWYLLWEAAYSLTFTRFGENEQLELPGHPRHRGHFKLGYCIKIYQNATSKQQVSLTPWVKGKYQSRMVLDRLNNLTEEGRFLGSIGLDAQFPYSKCSFWVDNLFNKLDAIDALQHPLSGRTFMLTCGGGWP